jgi:hypothetical protein
MVGVALSARRLARRIGPLDVSVRPTYNRLILASVGGAVPALIISELAYRAWGSGTRGSLVTLAGGGTVMVLTFLLIAIFMEIREVTAPIDKVLNRVLR